MVRNWVSTSANSVLKMIEIAASGQRKTSTDLYKARRNIAQTTLKYYKIVRIIGG